MDDDEAIALALSEAQAAAARGEVPVGAVLLSAEGGLLAADGNRIVERRDPTAHAEQLVLRAGAAKLGNERLTGTTLFVSLEPCAMCAGAISLARVGRVVFAAEDPKGGAILHGPKFFE
jgi:tRNA(adenine34) deaminase